MHPRFPAFPPGSWPTPSATPFPAVETTPPSAIGAQAQGLTTPPLAPGLAPPLALDAWAPNPVARVDGMPMETEALLASAQRTLANAKRRLERLGHSPTLSAAAQAGGPTAQTASPAPQHPPGLMPPPPPRLPKGKHLPCPPSLQTAAPTLQPALPTLQPALPTLQLEGTLPTPLPTPQMFFRAQPILSGQPLPQLVIPGSHGLTTTTPAPATTVTQPIANSSTGEQTTTPPLPIAPGSPMHDGLGALDPFVEPRGGDALDGAAPTPLSPQEAQELMELMEALPRSPSLGWMASPAPAGSLGSLSLGSLGSLDLDALPSLELPAHPAEVGPGEVEPGALAPPPRAEAPPLDPFPVRYAAAMQAIKKRPVESAHAIAQALASDRSVPVPALAERAEHAAKLTAASMPDDDRLWLPARAAFSARIVSSLHTFPLPEGCTDAQALHVRKSWGNRVLSDLREIARSALDGDDAAGFGGRGEQNARTRPDPWLARVSDFPGIPADAVSSLVVPRSTNLEHRRPSALPRETLSRLDGLWNTAERTEDHALTRALHHLTIAYVSPRQGARFPLEEALSPERAGTGGALRSSVLQLGAHVEPLIRSGHLKRLSPRFFEQLGAGTGSSPASLEPPTKRPRTAAP